MNVTIRLSTGGANVLARFDNWHKFKIPAGIANLTKGTADDMVQIARQIVRDKSKWHGKTPGLLEEGIKSRVAAMSSKKRVYMVSASAKSGDYDYAGAVEYGTKPHWEFFSPALTVGDKMAYGWKGKQYRFAPDGTWHLHPGSEGMSYMFYAFSMVLKNFDAAFWKYYKPIAGLDKI